MASLLSAVRTRFFDKSNKPLAGGKVYTYEANSTNPKVTWSDEALTVQNTNPVLLDNEGTALIFFSGKYRFRIEDKYGALVEDNPSVTSLVGIDGVTSDIVSTTIVDSPNQDDFNKKAVTTVESIADLNNLDKWDGRTIYVKNIGTYTYLNEKWQLKSKDFDYTPLSVLMGSIDDNQDVSAVIEALPDGSNVLIDLNCNIADVDISAKNINLKGIQAKWMKLTGVKGLQLNGSNCNVDELYIDTNGKSYGIVESGIDNTIQNVKFKGDVGHYIISMGVRPKVLKCEHAKGYSQITPFVFSGATDFLIEKCLLDEYTGFGIQARWCDGGRMKDNISNALFTTKTVKTTSSKTYTIDLGRQHSRFGVTVTNASNEEIPVPFNISNSGNIYTVTLDNTPASDRTLKLYATDALESYQVNSGCVDVVVQDNTSNGSGDSNIVIGCDYRFDGTNWILDPANVQESDEPREVRVLNNTCNEALYASIAVNHGQENISIVGNFLERAALCYDKNGAFNTNILMSVVGVVDQNTFKKTGTTVKNNITSLRSTSKSNKVGEAGLVIGSRNNFSKSGAAFENKFYFAASSEAIFRRQGTIVEGSYSSIGNELQTAFEAAFVGNMPVATDNFTFSNANGFLNKDTVNNVGGINSVYINAGTVIDIAAKAGLQRKLSNKLIRVRLFCSGKGRISFFPIFNGSSSSNIGIDVNEQGFAQKEIYFPAPDLSIFLLRLTSNAERLYIQDIDISYLST
ncbi:hypothetical protein MSG72_01440 [Acinetobacter sp. IK22]|uniref:hypothetical protein n=1 Tax=unclassified Acinetobacter TaxID=196816 RepID=UPI002D1E8453|nr:MULTISPECIES: hypothetical protein [unclassified Acinetobacter]MEB3793658.1 hypothetical protein [Acinetobacter sp. IK24]MEB3812972.1 hypothetical protein [Acinetobacter sp. IK22]MEB3832054.1 hypothetical protein [Acinetobacter sp. IK23]